MKQIVPKHSAILPAYPAYGIRANHIVSVTIIMLYHSQSQELASC